MSVDYLDGGNSAFSNRVLVETYFGASKNTLFKGISEPQRLSRLKHGY